ncbi:MAG: hypothetical protein NUW37_15495 [Planctomycetes bacterium]|nr:hypothetical protein [Planctomycetota bacterium]
MFTGPRILLFIIAFTGITGFFAERYIDVQGRQDAALEVFREQEKVVSQLRAARTERAGNASRTAFYDKWTETFNELQQDPEWNSMIEAIYTAAEKQYEDTSAIRPYLGKIDKFIQALELDEFFSAYENGSPVGGMDDYYNYWACANMLKIAEYLSFERMFDPAIRLSRAAFICGRDMNFGLSQSGVYGMSLMADASVNLIRMTSSCVNWGYSTNMAARTDVEETVSNLPMYRELIANAIDSTRINLHEGLDRLINADEARFDPRLLAAGTKWFDLIPNIESMSPKRKLDYIGECRRNLAGAFRELDQETLQFYSTSSMVAECMSLGAKLNALRIVWRLVNLDSQGEKFPATIEDLGLDGESTVDPFTDAPLIYTSDGRSCRVESGGWDAVYGYNSDGPTLLIDISR